MARSRAALAAVLASLLPATAIADRLVNAYLRGDDAEVARRGRLASAHDLAPGIVSPDRVTTLAAIAAAPSAVDAWELLLYLADLAGGADRPIAQAAARTADQIAATITADALWTFDIERDAIAKRAAAWAAIAARDDRWADVRVLALEISQQLSRALDPATVGLDLNAALLDLDPEFRRAALELLPSPVPTAERDRAARAAQQDPDPVVAIAAVQAVCSGLAFGDPAQKALAALGEEALSRARDAITDGSLPLTARMDAARCVAAEGSRASRAALAALAARAPKHLRKHIAAMTKRTE
jgi:hypothetical protein